jgi:hypothetical protein
MNDTTERNLIRFLLASLIALCVMFGVAHAVTVEPLVDAGALDAGSASAPVLASGSTALPDPVAQPIESVSLLVETWKGGTLPATIILGAFFLLSFLSRKVKALQKGYVAYGIAVALGGLAILVEPASRGTTPTWQMVGMALITAAALAAKAKLGGDVLYKEGVTYTPGKT